MATDSPIRTNNAAGFQDSYAVLDILWGNNVKGVKPKSIPRRFDLWKLCQKVHTKSKKLGNNIARRLPADDCFLIIDLPCLALDCACVEVTILVRAGLVIL